ncbi:MAG: aminotransferase class IV [Bacteroidota bacterium]
MEWFYVNGQFVERSQATIPVDQTGIARSFGIFDLFRTVNGQPRFFEDYLRRFSNSQRFLDLSRQIEEEEIRIAVTGLQERNGYDHSTFKMVLLGDGPDGAPVYDPFFYIMNFPLASQRPAGVKVITHEYVREFAEVKSLNYFTTFALTRKKAAAQAAEVIYHKDNLVSEASRCNVFVIRDGVLSTTTQHILHGITRMHVIEAAKQIMEVRLEDLSPSDLMEADEVFITSTTKDVMPVTHIDGQVVGTGKPGDMSSKLQKTFEDYFLDKVIVA